MKKLLLLFVVVALAWQGVIRTSAADNDLKIKLTFDREVQLEAYEEGFWSDRGHSLTMLADDGSGNGMEEYTIPLDPDVEGIGPDMKTSGFTAVVEDSASYRSVPQIKSFDKDGRPDPRFEITNLVYDAATNTYTGHVKVKDPVEVTVRLTSDQDFSLRSYDSVTVEGFDEQNTSLGQATLSANRSYTGRSLDLKGSILLSDPSQLSNLTLKNTSLPTDLGVKSSHYDKDQRLLTVDLSQKAKVQVKTILTSTYKMKFFQGSAFTIIAYDENNQVLDKATVTLTQGQEGNQIELPVSLSVADPEKIARVELSDTITKNEYSYSPISSTYDKVNKTLTISMGKTVHITVGALKDGLDVNTIYANALRGVEAELYEKNGDQQPGKLLQKSKPAHSYRFEGITFSGLERGKEYLFKLVKLPAGYEEYDISHYYTLTMVDNDYGHVLVDGHGPQGFTEDSDATTGRLSGGEKHPINILISRLPGIKKEVKNDRLGNNYGLEAEVSPNDLLSFRLTHTIYGDSNFQMELTLNGQTTKSLRYKSTTTIDLKDVLDDDRLSFVEGSLKVVEIVAGQAQAVNDYKVVYDSANHQLVLQTTPDPNHYKLDMAPGRPDSKLSLAKDRVFEITFQAKVKPLTDLEQWKKDFVNSVLASGREKIVKIVPRVWLKVDKTWLDQGQENLRPNKIMVRLYQNGQEIRHQELTADMNWTYIFKDLPKVDPQGQPYVYTITEDPVPGYKSVVKGTVITNMRPPVPPTVDIPELPLDPPPKEPKLPKTGAVR